MFRVFSVLCCTYTVCHMSDDDDIDVHRLPRPLRLRFAERGLMATANRLYIERALDRTRRRVTLFETDEEGDFLLSFVFKLSFQLLTFISLESYPKKKSLCLFAALSHLFQLSTIWKSRILTGTRYLNCCRPHRQMKTMPFLSLHMLLIRMAVLLTILTVGDDRGDNLELCELETVVDHRLRNLSTLCSLSMNTSSAK